MVVQGRGTPPVSGHESTSTYAETPSAATPASASRPPLYSLDQFKALRELGQGSYGVVKEVKHAVTGETFAMKVLQKERIVTRGLQEQLKREVLTQLRMKHPHLVQMLYYFEEPAEIFCLLEYGDGGQLFRYLKRQGANGVPEQRAALFFRDSTHGLAHLHSLRIAHRDLKPENILLFGKDLRAKIGDFGWCVELSEDKPHRLTFCGTLDYVAPEMLRGEPHNTAVDLWALGVLLHEMLLAKAPFTGSCQKETMDLICEADLRLAPQSLPRGPEALIRGLLRLHPASRTTAAEVLQHRWLAPAAAMVALAPAPPAEPAPPPRAAPKPKARAAAPTKATTPEVDEQGLDATQVVPRRAQRPQALEVPAPERVQGLPPHAARVAADAPEVLRPQDSPQLPDAGDEADGVPEPPPLPSDMPSRGRFGAGLVSESDDLDITDADVPSLDPALLWRNRQRAPRLDGLPARWPPGALDPQDPSPQRGQHVPRPGAGRGSRVNDQSDSVGAFTLLDDNDLLSSVEDRRISLHELEDRPVGGLRVVRGAGARPTYEADPLPGPVLPELGGLEATAPYSADCCISASVVRTVPRAKARSVRRSC